MQLEMWGLKYTECIWVWVYMGVYKNSGTPKSSMFLGFSIVNHPFWDTPIFGNTHIVNFHSTCMVHMFGRLVPRSFAASSAVQVNMTI